jgi:hypothetical protein
LEGRGFPRWRVGLVLGPFALNGKRDARDPSQYQPAAQARVQALRIGAAWFPSLARFEVALFFFCIFPGEIDILKKLAMCKTSPWVSPC